MFLVLFCQPQPRKTWWSQCGAIRDRGTGESNLATTTPCTPNHPHHLPLPRAVNCVASQKDEEEETTIQSILEKSGTPLGYRGGAAGKDLNRVEEQTPRAPWAAALSSPWLRISSFPSKRVEVTVFLSQLMNRFWVAGVTIETGAILSK